MRGRVMGLYMLVFLGGTPIGSPLAGWVAEVFGPRMVLICGGLISLAATVAVGLVLAHRGDVRVRSYLRPARLARLLILRLRPAAPAPPASGPLARSRWPACGSSWRSCRRLRWWPS